MNPKTTDRTAWRRALREFVRVACRPLLAIVWLIFACEPAAAAERQAAAGDAARTTSPMVLVPGHGALPAMTHIRWLEDASRSRSLADVRQDTLAWSPTDKRAPSSSCSTCASRCSTRCTGTCATNAATCSPNQAGDRVLSTVVQAVQSQLRRESDPLFRLGGEEFGVLFPATGEAQATRIVDAWRRAVQLLALPHQASASGIVTASFGLACWSADDAAGLTPDTMYAQPMPIACSTSPRRVGAIGWSAHRSSPPIPSRTAG